MKPAKRSQVDDLGDLYSVETAIDTSVKPDLARQEYKDETDLNKLLFRYGVGLLPGQRQPTWGQEIDYDMDLQTALSAVADAKRAWAGLPPNLKAAYPSWRELLNALESGRLEIKAEEPIAEPSPAAVPPLEA